MAVWLHYGDKHCIIPHITYILPIKAVIFMEQEKIGFFKRHKRLSYAIIGLFLFIWGLPLLLALGDDTDTPASQPVTRRIEPTAIPTPTEVRLGAFLREYEENELAASDKWEGKRIEFSAVITDIRSTLGTPHVDLGVQGDTWGKEVSCSFDDREEVLEYKVGDAVSASVYVSDYILGDVMAKDCRLSIWESE